MDYKKKYLKYKKKYIELQNLLNGGALILPWFPLRSNQLYIEAVIDPESHIGSEIIDRLKDMGIVPGELHVTILEILIPEARQNIKTSENNPIDLYIKDNIETDAFKNSIKDIYNTTLGGLMGYSRMDNYACYGKFFVRKYDDPKTQLNLQECFKNFKINIIHQLINKSSFKSNFKTLIHRPLVVLTSSSNPKIQPVITKKYTHYYQTGVNNNLDNPVPTKNSNQYTSLFAISEYFNTPSLDQSGNLIGWVPHISITTDDRSCKNIDVFKEEFKAKAKKPISMLPMWSSSILKQRPDDPTKEIRGSILKLIIRYAGKNIEIDLSN